jgi:hypothetical protein
MLHAQITCHLGIGQRRDIGDGQWHVNGSGGKQDPRLHGLHLEQIPPGTHAKRGYPGRSWSDGIAAEDPGKHIVSRK